MANYKRERHVAYISIVWAVLALFGLVGIIMKKELGFVVCASVAVFWVLLQILMDGYRATLILQAVKKQEEENK